jgi:phosphatidylglycerophosphate synthase
VKRGIRGHIPNILSLSRILMAFAFPFLPVSLRLPVIFWSLASEFFDGFLARRWNAVTSLGQALDPIADKLFVLSTVFVLISEGTLSWLDFSLIAMRDIVVAVGVFSVMAESRQSALLFLKPRYSGKIATALQFGFLVALYAFPGGLLRSDLHAFFLVTAIASCLSAFDYLYFVLHRRFDPLATKSFQDHEASASLPKDRLEA